MQVSTNAVSVIPNQSNRRSDPGLLLSRRSGGMMKRSAAKAATIAANVYFIQRLF